MIQDIHPHRFDIGFTPRPPTGDDYLVFLSGEKVALRRGPGEEGFFPTFASLASWLPDSPEFTYLFRLDDRAFYYAGFSLPGETRLDFHSSQLFRELPPPWMGFAGITAHHLANWYANNRFCGACGGRMTPKEEERALACPACATSVYPRISPAVIVGVVNGSRLLLTRYANRPYRNYALIAGFVEVGETLEDAAHREVFEETGVRVKNLNYYKSQPWGFSGSILAGFFAELDGSPELNIDSNELEDAQWLGAEDIPLHDDGVSLTGEMMQVFRHRYLLA